MLMPISIKGVVFAGDLVVLAENDRGEWELPGGRLEPGESPQDALRRETFEECGLHVSVTERPLDAFVYDVFRDGSRFVFIVTFGCHADGAEPRPSEEHLSVGLWSVEDALALANLPIEYRTSIDLFARQIRHVRR